jgi:HEPN domain-containing protein
VAEELLKLGRYSHVRFMAQQCAEEALRAARRWLRLLRGYVGEKR